MYPRVADTFVGKESLPLLVWVDYERVSLVRFASIKYIIHCLCGKLIVL